MKQILAFALLAVMLLGMLCGCARLNDGIQMPFEGNTSTTDDGEVNGQNRGLSREWSRGMTENPAAPPKARP